MDLGVPGVDAGHLNQQSNVRYGIWLGMVFFNYQKYHMIQLRTLQVTIAPTLGSSCVSVSLTTEITGS